MKKSKKEELTKTETKNDEQLLSKLVDPVMPSGDESLSGDIVQDQPKKRRHRRTKAEIEAERARTNTVNLSEEGFEAYADIFQSVNDMDVRRWGVKSTTRETYYPFSRCLARIGNYYFAKFQNPVLTYAIIGAVQGFSLFKGRIEEIDAIKKKTVPQKQVEPSPVAQEQKKETVISLTSHIPDNTGEGKK